MAILWATMPATIDSHSPQLRRLGERRAKEATLSTDEPMKNLLTTWQTEIPDVSIFPTYLMSHSLNFKLQYTTLQLFTAAQHFTSNLQYFLLNVAIEIS